MWLEQKKYCIGRYIPMTSYKSIDLQKKKSDALVIHCADPRFQGAYQEVISGLGEYFDLLVIPGASKAVVDNPSTIDYMKMLHDLHHFEEIHVMDHIECGAFGQIDDEQRDHSACLHAAKEKIEAALPGVRVTAHLLGQKQELPVEV